VTAAPVASLQAELEVSILAEVKDFGEAFVAAYPGASLSEYLRALGSVFVAVLLDVAEAQANGQREVPLSRVMLMGEVVRPVMLRAIHDTTGAIATRRAG
jgi:hypothetical protein